MDISTQITKIESASSGEEVRTAIVQALQYLDREIDSGEMTLTTSGTVPTSGWLRARRRGALVHFSGMIKGAIGLNGSVAQIPANLLPLYFSAAKYSNNGNSYLGSRKGCFPAVVCSSVSGAASSITTVSIDNDWNIINTGRAVTATQYLAFDFWGEVDETALMVYEEDET